MFKEFKSTPTWLQFPFLCAASKASVHDSATETNRHGIMHTRMHIVLHVSSGLLSIFFVLKGVWLVLVIKEAVISTAASKYKGSCFPVGQDPSCSQSACSPLFSGDSGLSQWVRMVCLLCGPAINWGLIQADPASHPKTAGIRYTTTTYLTRD